MIFAVLGNVVRAIAQRSGEILFSASRSRLIRSTGADNIDPLQPAVERPLSGTLPHALRRLEDTGPTGLILLEKIEPLVGTRGVIREVGPSSKRNHVGAAVVPMWRRDP